MIPEQRRKPEIRSLRYPTTMKGVFVPHLHTAGTHPRHPTSHDFLC